MESALYGIYTLFYIRNRTSERSERVRFLIGQQLVCKYRTPAPSMKYSLVTARYFIWVQLFEGRLVLIQS